MWAIDNPTPYAAGKSWTRSVAGEHVWLVVLKATFDVDEQGKTTASDEQGAPLLVPDYHGKPGESSLRHETEVVPAKPTTDVLLLGSAHAPRGRPVRKIGVSLRVGPVYKELVVFGPRVYRGRGIGEAAVSTPAEVTRQALTYEWAYGGSDLGDPDPAKWIIDPRNPVGKGIARNARALVDRAAHCIEYPSGAPERVGPAGFGPIAGHWSPRLEFAGTYDERWAQTRKPLLPLDYDPRHELCAPADQRPQRHLEGGEPVELVNLAPWGVWRFHLPRLVVSFVTAFGRRRVEHAGVLSTVMLEPDVRRVTMIWQTALTVTGPDCDYLDRTTVSVRSR